MTFSTSSLAFGGTPTISGKINVVVGLTVTYPGGPVIEATSTVVVKCQSGAPTVSVSINSASPTVGNNSTQLFDVTTFVIPSGSTPIYYAQLSNGIPLPSWLFFMPITRTFRFIAPLKQTFLVAVTASDNTGQSITNTFKFNFTHVFPTIIAPMPDVTVYTQQ